MATKKHYTQVDTHYEAEEGYWFRRPDSYVYGRKIWLGCNDSIDNWAIITDAEKVKLEEEEKAELEKLMNDLKATEATDENA